MLSEVVCMDVLVRSQLNRVVQSYIGKQILVELLQVFYFLCDY